MRFIFSTLKSPTEPQYLQFCSRIGLSRRDYHRKPSLLIGRLINLKEKLSKLCLNFHDTSLIKTGLCFMLILGLVTDVSKNASASITRQIPHFMIFFLFVGGETAQYANFIM